MTGGFQGGLYFVAALLVLSAVLTLALGRSRRATSTAAKTVLSQQ
jgi:ACS family tartrate transporter-like MFS transporter